MKWRLRGSTRSGFDAGVVGLHKESAGTTAYLYDRIRC